MSPIFLSPVGTILVLQDITFSKKVISPLSGLISPAINLSILDLPDPDGPNIDITSLFSKEKLISSNILLLFSSRDTLLTFNKLIKYSPYVSS